MISLVKDAPAIHVVEMRFVDGHRHDEYGITAESAHVFVTNRSSYPTRVMVWSNFHSLNPRDGQPVRYGDMGPIDGGNGRYLDPNNHATNAASTWLLSTESISITAQRNGTGHPDSGQVWATGTRIADGDIVILCYPDSIRTWHTVELPRFSNGHGSLTVPTKVTTPSGYVWNAETV